MLELVSSSNSLVNVRLALERAGSTIISRRQVVSRTYYDGPELTLWQQQLCFWVQKRGSRCVQVLSSCDHRTESGANGGEKRDRIDGDKPDLTAPQTGPELRAAAGDDLRPLFKTQTRQTTFSTTTESAVEIAVALDEGMIVPANGAAAEADCRVTLELRSGEPASVYDMAVWLLDAGPLRVATQSRLERGYQLSGLAPRAATAERLILEPSMTIEAVLQSAGRECLNHMLRNEAAAVAGEPEAFHQMRVAVRRLRSLLMAVRSVVPAEQYQWLDGELKSLAAELEAARDWDVFAMDLLAPVRSVLRTEPDLETLAEAVRQRQHAAYEAARTAIGSRNYAETVLKMIRWFETCRWRDQHVSEQSAPLFSSAGEGAPLLIERRWRQALKRSKRFAELSQEERHELRIALKKLRYMIEFFASLYEAASVKALMKQLKRLQDDLGHLNDVSTAQQRIKELQRLDDHGPDTVSQAASMVIGWYLRELTESETKLRRDVRRFRKAKPFWQRKRESAGLSELKIAI